MPKILIKPISAEETRELRHTILRSNQPPETCVYPGDEDARTGHFGAFQNGNMVGIASIFCEVHPNVAADLSWRIRGMATTEAVRGQGAGAALLAACIQHAQSHHGDKIWCNARSTAAGFYQKFQFQQQGDVFPLPGIGPHYLMVLAIS